MKSQDQTVLVIIVNSVIVQCLKSIPSEENTYTIQTQPRSHNSLSFSIIQTAIVATTTAKATTIAEPPTLELQTTRTTYERTISILSIRLCQLADGSAVTCRTLALLCSLLNLLGNESSVITQANIRWLRKSCPCCPNLNTNFDD